MLEGWGLVINFPSLTGREADKVAYIEAYLKANKLFRDYTNTSQDPVFTKVSLMLFAIACLYHAEVCLNVFVTVKLLP